MNHTFQITGCEDSSVVDEAAGLAGESLDHRADEGPRDDFAGGDRLLSDDFASAKVTNGPAMNVRHGLSVRVYYKNESERLSRRGG